MDRRGLPINSKTQNFWRDVLTHGAHAKPVPDYGSDTINEYTIRDVEFLDVSEYAMNREQGGVISATKL